MSEELDLKLAEIKELFNQKDLNIERQHAEIQRLRAVLKTYQSQWIPCDERLPSKADNYLISETDGSQDVAYFNPLTEKWFVNKEQNLWVIAWMPLPKMYEK